MKTVKQNNCIKWIENVLDTEYPYNYRDNYYDAQEFIHKWYDIAKQRSLEIDNYRKKEENKLKMLLYMSL